VVCQIISYRISESAQRKLDVSEQLGLFVAESVDEDLRVTRGQELSVRPVRLLTIGVHGRLVFSEKSSALCDAWELESGVDGGCRRAIRFREPSASIGT